MQLSSVGFNFLYDGSVDMKISAVLTKNQCRLTVTRMTVKACGALVSEKFTIFVNNFPFLINLSFYIYENKSIQRVLFNTKCRIYSLHVDRPICEFFSLMETSPLPMKGCKF